ncbi:hypothetical protein M436DRAFT_46567 [Aureobasidium namibiae CBS 147.97]|uniref:Uncharacterized protein n=1 Tax=Aureobasidium namibiae CBS 147.97 TaxID=1043004 RepID=A0A074WJK1_9PEZI
MSLANEIFDEFGELSAAERHETTATLVSQFADVMRDNNKRIFSRVLDMIAETEGDDKLHLDMLATHHDIEGPEYIEAKSWDMPEITTFSDYRARTHLGDDSGICDPESESSLAYYLSDLEAAVRKNADRDLLGSLADSLQLPAEFVEFLKHTSGVTYPNLDKSKFLCAFATELYWADKHAKLLEQLYRFSGCSGFKVAAGWKAGDNGYGRVIYYLLCKDDEEPDEPWQWRIWVNIAYSEVSYFDCLRDFLCWYCHAYDWVDWDIVEMDIDDLNKKCKEASKRDQEQGTEEESE